MPWHSQLQEQNLKSKDMLKIYMLLNDDMTEDTRLLGVKVFITTDAGEDT